MQKQLTDFKSIDWLYVDGTFKSAPKFFHQLFTIHGLTMCNLHFSYRPINTLCPMRMCQTYGIRGCKTWCECFTNNCLRWLRNRQQCGQAWKLKHVFFFTLRQSQWRKMQSLGLSKQYGKKYSEVSQFLKKIFGLSLLPPVEIGDRSTLEFLSHLPNDEQVEQFCDYLLENYIDADSTFPLPVWSECTASSLRTDHKRMWVIPCPLQCTIL